MRRVVTAVQSWLARLDDLMMRSEMQARPGGMRCPHCTDDADVLFVIPAAFGHYGVLCPRCQRARNGLVRTWRREYFRLVLQPYLPCGCRNLEAVR